MSLFQKSVLNKHFSNLDIEKTTQAWQKFQQNYNPKKIEEIKTLKEEVYQDGFLRDIFVDVFGYTLQPEENYNLQREFKNQADSKKADGAILKNGKALAVIELKSTKTKDLTKVTEQAFNYKNNQPDCKYVITSNFRKLHFYIDYAHEYEEFDLFRLTEEEFKLLYLLLNKDNLLINLPLQIKKETKFHEQAVSDKLYKDYSSFKSKLFANLIKNQPEHDKLKLFKSSQKLLDRFLFILFAEDCGLLPPNSISRIIKRFHILEEEDAYKPLYEIYVQYFHYMNSGRKGKKAVDDIPAYNGGLFYPDEELDALVIDDQVLIDDLLNLSKYDFNTEVDVNVLGHIFEHSLNEIEDITAQLEGRTTDKKKSKRKKDGVFYTPKYITQYIVENTVGTLCKEKRKELNIEEVEFDGTYKKANGGLKKAGEKLYKTLNDYKDWLLSLKILDPACGSGAFLNQALQFLIAEHKHIDDILEELTGHSLPIFDTDKSILENNLFGVDINEESVEIAQLSLWLRTAKRDRKLSSLNNNIKCGNSLIDDPEVAGDKAFDWNVEFKEIMDKGGFDVVIGNPPYVRAELLTDYREYLEQQYSVFDPAGDLFSYFYEQAFTLLKNEVGLFGFISNTFDKTKAGVSLRKYLKENITFYKYIDFTEVQIFEGATTYPIILLAKNAQDDNAKFRYVKISREQDINLVGIDAFPKTIVTQSNLENQSWSFKSDEAFNLMQKISENTTIRNLYGKCFYGIKTALNEAFIIPTKLDFDNEHVKPIYEGKELKKWSNPPIKQQLILFQSKWTKSKYGQDITEEKALANLKQDYPEIISQLLPYEERAKKRYDKGDFYWELRNCAYYDLFEKPKIVFPNLQNSNKFSFDESGSYICAPSVILPTADKFLISILNSKVVWYFLTNICVVRSGGYIEVKPQYFEQIPIPVNENTEQLELITEKVISLTTESQQKISKFLNRTTDTFEIEKLSKKMDNFYDFDFKTYVAELKKKKVKLSLLQQDEWEDYFNVYKIEINDLQNQINQTEKEIDQMVYELYGLTDEEINIVEIS